MFSYDVYCLEGEVWESIPRYEGLYEASTLGRIRTVDGKKTYTKRHGIRTWKGRILKNKTKVMKSEGFKVDLWKDGKPRHWLVARLICSTFHGIVDEDLPVKTKMTVNHKDLDRSNNKPENIEWMSHGDNIRHGYANGAYDNCKKKGVSDD